MDMQGTPIGNTSGGTKVTSDPRTFNNPIQERAGQVASDSLAAESTRQGGGFSENRGSEPLDVSGSKSTLNTTDTSGATTLPKAPDAPARDGSDTQERYPEALGGQGTFPGSHVPVEGYVGGSSQAKRDLGIQQSGEYVTTVQQDRGMEPPEARGSGQQGGPAPNYVMSTVRNVGSTNMPGKNVTQGDVNPNAKNASFESDIGTKQDPGRLAENKFQRTVAKSGHDTGYPSTSERIQHYGALKVDERA